jgi:hypothetical protein
MLFSRIAGKRKNVTYKKDEFGEPVDPEMRALRRRLGWLTGQYGNHYSPQHDEEFVREYHVVLIFLLGYTTFKMLYPSAPMGVLGFCGYGRCAHSSKLVNGGRRYPILSEFCRISHSDWPFTDWQREKSLVTIAVALLPLGSVMMERTYVCPRLSKKARSYDPQSLD